MNKNEIKTYFKEMVDSINPHDKDSGIDNNLGFSAFIINHEKELRLLTAEEIYDIFGLSTQVYAVLFDYDCSAIMDLIELPTREERIKFIKEKMNSLKK